MALDTVYDKTQIGRLEVKTRSSDLTPIQRRILILADGRRTAEAILKFSRVVNYQQILDELVGEGFLEIVGGTRDPIPVAPSRAPAAGTDRPATGGQQTPVAAEGNFAEARDFMLATLASHSSPAKTAQLVAEIQQASTSLDLTRYVDDWYGIISDNPYAASIVDDLRKSLVEKLSS